jgi:hypothetical protein
MRLLFVAPNPLGSGEALTALAMAHRLAPHGHEIRFVGSPLALRLLGGAFPGDELSDDAGGDRRWRARLVDFRPDAIVFADYPLLWLHGAGRRLLAPENWSPIESLSPRLMTLDHLGMAAGPMTLPFGPPHLEPVPAYLPALPAGMTVLRPCPPWSAECSAPIDAIAFRCWDVPLTVPAGRRQAIRERFTRSPDEQLVSHAVAGWAVEFCRRHGLPHYARFTSVLEHLFSAVPAPITVLSVNGGGLLAPSSSSRLRVVNLGQLGPRDYDDLLLASDLMITDNCISVSLAKAACGLVPCVALRNSFRLQQLVDHEDAGVRAIVLGMEGERLGSVFPFEVFPIWSREDVDRLGVFSGNPLRKAFVMVEMYGGAGTRQTIADLLSDTGARDALRRSQAAWVASLRRLPPAEEAMAAVLR